MLNGSKQTVPLTLLRRHSIRQKQRSRDQLIALAESWLALPVHPIVVRPPTGEPPMYDVADGNGRLDGLELLGVAEAEVFVTDADLTDSMLDDIGFVTAYHREGLSCSEQADIVIRKRQAGVSNKDVAKTLGIHEGWASKLYSLADCVAEVQQAAREGRIDANK
jgi:ParB-like chromosome segregation protein Spo0J